jgi:hypothetical protein
MVVIMTLTIPSPPFMQQRRRRRSALMTSVAAKILLSCFVLFHRPGQSFTNRKGTLPPHSKKIVGVANHRAGGYYDRSLWSLQPNVQDNDNCRNWNALHAQSSNIINGNNLEDATNNNVTNNVTAATTTSTISTVSTIAPSTSASPPKKTNAATASSTKKSTPPTTPISNTESPDTTNNTIVGIGGKGGLVYDVNRLKRNLLQETVRAYKRELWELLSSPSSPVMDEEEEIVNKLAALVQASPVSTTTDSNLLDGDWVLAYTSQQDVNVLLDPRRFARANRILRKRKPASSSVESRSSSVLTTECTKQPPPLQGTKGGILRTQYRKYTLEDVDDARAPYVIDTCRWLGGIVSEKRFYSITGLSRTSLNMDVVRKEWFLGGNRETSLYNITYVPSSRERRRPRVKVQVIYLDVDLCISAEVRIDEYDDGDDEETNGKTSFRVYTKNEAWMDRKQRVRRKVRFVLDGMERMAKWVLPVHWIKRKFFTQQLMDDDAATYSSKMLVQVKNKAGNSSVRVLKIGSTNDDDEEENVAWDGDMDPFVHMSADERQEQLRAMNMRQIDRAQRRQQAKARRERWVKWLIRRKTFFKKPE